MTTEEAMKVATEIRAQRYDPRHYTTEFAAQQACMALADALREAQAAVVQMREDAARVADLEAAESDRLTVDGPDERFGWANIARGERLIAKAIRALPAPAARTYEDGVRDAAKAIRDQAVRTFGKPTTVANGYAEVAESLLSPAPAARTYDDGVRDAAKAVRSVETRIVHQRQEPITESDVLRIARDRSEACAAAVERLISPAPAVAPVAAPKPATATARAPKRCPGCDVQEGLPCHPFCPNAPDKEPAAFDAEAALVALWTMASPGSELQQAAKAALIEGRGGGK